MKEGKAGAEFIHVSSAVPIEEATIATKISIRETLSYLSRINIRPDPRIITGPNDGKTGEEYPYNISTGDID